jgi:hypothetical protein
MMLLGQLDCKFSDNITRISLQGSIECAITIDDDETKRWLSNQQFLLELVQVEFGIAVVDGKVDRFERLKVDGDFLFRC